MSLSRKIVATGVCVFLLSACGSQTSNTSSGRNSRDSSGADQSNSEYNPDNSTGSDAANQESSSGSING